jgi:hypothetical protein
MSLIKTHQLHLTNEDLITFELSYKDAVTLLSYLDEYPQVSDLYHIHEELHTQVYK